MITPEMFKEKIEEIIQKRTEVVRISIFSDPEELFDEELAHLEADELLCQVLSELGYHEGVELFKSMHKHY